MSKSRIGIAVVVLTSLLSGAALANVTCQTTFPYLTAIFLLQMWVAIAFLAAIARLRLSG